MEKLIINIDGVPTEIMTRRIEADKIYLDQENPRAGQFRDSQCFNMEKPSLGA